MNPWSVSCTLRPQPPPPFPPLSWGGDTNTFPHLKGDISPPDPPRGLPLPDVLLPSLTLPLSLPLDPFPSKQTSEFESFGEERFNFIISKTKEYRTTRVSNIIRDPNWTLSRSSVFHETLPWCHEDLVERHRDRFFPDLRREKWSIPETPGRHRVSCGGSHPAPSRRCDCAP